MKNILILSTLIVLILSTGCTSQKKQIEISSKSIVEAAPMTETVVDIDTNESVIKNYITDFLTKGYSNYYVVNSIESKIISQNSENDKIEATIYTNMNTNNLIKNPDTIPYIQEAKEKAYKENDPEKKHILQQEYMALYSEYLKPMENNFAFKLTAELKDDKINEESILLFIEVDADQGIKYEPAEMILPERY